MIRGFLKIIGLRGEANGGLATMSSQAPVCLVSYPKSGSTWVRFVLGNYLSGNQCDFHNVDEWVPDVHAVGDAVGGTTGLRLQKSHFPKAGAMGPVVYLVRDGRDVAVSYYKHQLKNRVIRDDYGFDRFLDDFNKGAVFPGISWNDHVMSWCADDAGPLLIIRYEDLLTDAGKQISCIMRFCGLEVDEVRLASAIEASSFEAMRELEKKQHDSAKHLSGTRADIRHVREGKAGTWRDYFGDDALDEFMRTQRVAMSLLGYDL